MGSINYLDFNSIVDKFRYNQSSIREKDNQINKAYSSLSESINYYKINDISNALKKVEESIDFYILPEAYYHYGDFFMEIKEYDKAMTAYNISIQIYYDYKYQSYYKLSCCSSIIHNYNEAYSYLEKATIYGYPNISYYLTDPNLEYLRSQSSWEAHYSNYIELNKKGNNPYLFMDKTYIEESASILNEYHFSSDGTVTVNYKISNDKDHYKHGHWSYKNYFLTILWYLETGEKGIGEPFHCSARCWYKEYEQYSKEINENIVFSRDDLYLFFKIKEFEN